MKNLRTIFHHLKGFNVITFNSTHFIVLAFSGICAGICFFYGNIILPHSFFWMFIFLPVLFLFLTEKNILFVVAYFLLFIFLGFLLAGVNYCSYTGDIKGTGRLTGFVKEGNFYKQAPIKLLKADKATKTNFKGRISLDSNLNIFDTIYFEGEIRKPHMYKNISNKPFFYEHFLHSRKVLHIREQRILSSNNFFKSLSMLREKLIRRFDKLNLEGRVFFIEVLFGEKRLDQKTRDVFGRTGAAHILSISGLHFSLTVFFAYILVYVLVFFIPSVVDVIPRQALTVIVALPLLVIYAYLSGLSIPATRAFLFFLLSSMFLLFFKKNFNTLNLLFLVALLLVINAPETLFNLSFQLSFISVFALVLCYKHLFLRTGEERFFAKVRKYLLNMTLSSAIISLFIYPLIQDFSNQSILASIFSNIFVIPLFSFFILPFLFISLPFSFNESIFSYILFMPDVGWKVFWWYINLLDRVFSKFSLNVYFDWKSAIIYYSVLLSLFFVKGLKKLLVLLVGIILLLITLPTPLKGPVLVFPDVGQGDCAVLKTEDNRVVFIDAGGNMWDENIFNKVYVPLMRTLGVNKIDYLILSHGHPDHTNAVEALVKNYAVDRVISGSEVKAGKVSNIIHVDKAPYTFERKGLKIIVFPGIYGSKDNNTSLWTYIEYMGKSLLFTGDTEKDGIGKMLRKVKLKKIDILKVPHHGAFSSFNQELYELKPDLAIISVGANNAWGLPSKEVTNFLRYKGIKYYRTDEDGEIIVNLKENSVYSYKNYYEINH